MRYFSMEEMERSEMAVKKGIDNHIPNSLLPNMVDLIDNVLDPLREAYGKPIHINSGFRSVALNKAVAGSRTSDHLKARAADIVGTPNTKEENKRLFEMIQSLDLPFKQLINEYDFSWVHVSYDKRDNKGQVLAL